MYYGVVWKVNEKIEGKGVTPILHKPRAKAQKVTEDAEKDR